jgi:hypothetical protein
MMSKHFLPGGAVIALIVVQVGCGGPSGSAPNDAPKETTNQSAGTKTAAKTVAKAPPAAGSGLASRKTVTIGDVRIFLNRWESPAVTRRAVVTTFVALRTPRKA